MFKPEEAWYLFLNQAVKAIEKGIMWSNDSGRTYYTIIETSDNHVSIKQTNNPSVSATLLPDEVFAADEKLSKSGKIAVGELFDDEMKESLFVLLHPYVRIRNSEKYIKIIKRFRNKVRKETS